MIREQVAARATSSAPLVTWRSHGARAELSGRTLANGIWKAANYLADEVDLGPGDTIAVRLGAHWQSTVWQAASLLIGCTLVAPTAADVVIAFPDDEKSHAHGARALLAVSPHPLGLPAAHIPAGWRDASSEVRASPDILLGVAPEPTVFWRNGEHATTGAELMTSARGAMPQGDGPIAVLGAPAGRDALVWHVALPVLLGQPVVLAETATAAELAAEHATRVVHVPVG